jgi:hypothetical protein
MPCFCAASITGANRSKLSSIEQLVFLRQKASEAAVKMAISSTLASTAPFIPCLLGTRTG